MDQPPVPPAPTEQGEPVALSPPLLHAMLEASHCGLVLLDDMARVIYWNPWVVRTSGVALEEARGRRLGEIFPESAGGRLHQAVEESLITGLPAILSPRLNPHPLPLRAYAPDGRGERLFTLMMIKALPVEGGARRTMIQILDISNSVARERQLREQARELRAQAEAIGRLADHDNLTGLANRRLLSELFFKARSRAKRSGRPLAALYLDLDHFKPINDLFGHRIGDLMLVEMAERMKACLRGSDCVARIGGDEFVVLLESLHHEEDAVIGAQKLREAVGAVCRIEGKTLQVGVSIGVALYPRDGEELEMLLRQADAAMYRVKQSGKNGVALTTREEGGWPPFG
ncbi:MAG: diguanylate cyclase [Magnetococcales bacterium]|nr:diguanylate cyclase [Magnetococcales bacterium]